MKITIAQFSNIVVTKKKSNATLNLKVKTMDGLVQRTIGVLYCTLTYHYFIGRFLLGFMEHVEDPCHTNSTSRIVPGDVCERSKTRRHGNNVRICRLTHQFSCNGHVIVFMLGCYDHFSQCFTFFSQRFQRFNHVVVNVDQCWQSKQMDTECN